MDTNWVEPVVQLTDADFCKIFNRESQLGREEGGDSPFWKVKEDFEDLGFRLFGLACRHICQTHISDFTSQSHARLDHSRLILRHWQFHNFSALADSLDESDSTLTVSQYFIVVLSMQTLSPRLMTDALWPSWSPIGGVCRKMRLVLPPCNSDTSAMYGVKQSLHVRSNKADHTCESSESLFITQVGIFKRSGLNSEKVEAFVFFPIRIYFLWLRYFFPDGEPL